MEVTVKKGSIARDFTGDYQITMIVPKEEQSNMEPLNELLNDDKLKTCAIDHKKKKRSLNANAYCWKLCTEIANVLRASKDEIYVSMLKKYGQSAIYTVLDEAVPLLMKTVKYHEIVKEHSELNGKLYTHVKVFVGSSEYDTREMAILIDGIVSDAKELKICTMTSAEIQAIKEQWGR